MISKQVPHTYIQHSTRFFALFVRLRSTDEDTEIDAHNFYIFDEKGYCWLQMIHVEKSYVLNQLGNGFFQTRHILEIEDPLPAYQFPSVDSDAWIQRSIDRGYALEIIREGLGLNLIYLTQLMKTDDP